VHQRQPVGQLAPFRNDGSFYDASHSLLLGGGGAQTKQRRNGSVMGGKKRINKVINKAFARHSAGGRHLPSAVDSTIGKYETKVTSLSLNDWFGKFKTKTECKKKFNRE
jgi:hypothetical protein